MSGAVSRRDLLRGLPGLGAAALLARRPLAAATTESPAAQERLGPLSADVLPVGIRSRFVENINGLRMHVLEAGFETPGRPAVLLLHGFPELAPLSAAAQYTTVSVPALVEGSLDSNDPVQGDGTHYERYAFSSAAGVTYAITLRSPDFDAYLTAAAPESTAWIQDDDGAGGTDASIQLTPQTSGRCHVVATGRFRLGVSSGTADLTVPSLEEFVRQLVARTSTQVVAWEVDQLNRADPVGVGGLNLEEGVGYSVWVIFEGNAPPVPSELRFTLFAAPSLETLRTTNVVPSMTFRVDGFHAVAWQFVAPPTPRGQTLQVMLSRWEGDYTSRPAAIVVRRL